MLLLFRWLVTVNQEGITVWRLAKWRIISSIIVIHFAYLVLGAFIKMAILKFYISILESIFYQEVPEVIDFL